MNGATFPANGEGDGSAGEALDHRLGGRSEGAGGGLGGSVAEASAEDGSSGGRSAEDERPLIAPSERRGTWAEEEARRTCATGENGWDDALRSGEIQSELRHAEGAVAGEARGDGDRGGAERLRGGGGRSSADANGCAEASSSGSGGGGAGEVAGEDRGENEGEKAGRGEGEEEKLIRGESGKAEEEGGKANDLSGNGKWVDGERGLRGEEAEDPSADGGGKGKAGGECSGSESSRRTADGERSFVWLLNPLETQDDVEAEGDEEEWEEVEEGKEGEGEGDWEWEGEGEGDGEEGGAATGEAARQKRRRRRRKGSAAAADGGAAGEGTGGRSRGEGSRSGRAGGGGAGGGGGGGAENAWRALEGHEDKFVELQKLFVGPKFATGTYGRLYQGLYEGQDVAIKILRPPDSEGEAEKLAHQFKQEVDLLARLDHPNVVRFVGACQRPPTWCILTEYLGGGSLRAFLQKREGALLPLPDVLRLALDIARGMEYLHAEGVVHRDLKPDNLVLTTDNVVKITDFGVARLEADTSMMTAETGTYRWMAPEVVDHRPYSKNVDVYSFGIVLWELCTVQLPFAGMTAMQAAFAVVNKGTRPDISANIPVPLVQLMQACWHTNPDRRPPFSEVVQQLEAMQDALTRDPNALQRQPPPHTPRASPSTSPKLFCCC
ncbi:hypothetical protein CLOM_g7303 [Closterium sp. NIES-68]|nr:hypothetical protein CLOM_g7303 [Closterium sp. NIES-68]GJP81289.1 hypothetical protein CLOP_g11446 [Closterium sp. NIES-67]